MPSVHLPRPARGRMLVAITAGVVGACAIVIAAPGAAMASTAGPATVRPLTGEGCYGPEECTEVVGTGLKVTSISGEFNNMTGLSQTIYIDYYGPNGHITNTADMTVPNGGTTGLHTWHNPNPNTPMTPGYYCTEAFFSDGTPLVSDCIQVHT